MSNSVLDLESSNWPDKLERLVSAAPFYGDNIGPVIRRIIEMIHGIPGLYPRVELADIQVYLGRSTINRLQSRYKHSMKKHDHVGAAVICRCDPRVVDQIERAGIRVINGLKRRGALCVGNVNVADDSRGRNADPEDGGILYMTWGECVNGNEFQGKPTTAVIRTVASEVSNRLAEEDIDIPAEDIEDGLIAARALTTRLALKFAR